MPQWTGFLDSTGTPRLKLAIGGVLNTPPKEFDAVIDTGFTGFLSMPLIQAFPLGLPLTGSTEVTLADGSKAAKLIALGSAFIGAETQIGTVILEPNASDVLLGMDFLRSFGKVLMLHPHQPFVVFEDCTVVDAALAAGRKTP